MEELDYREYQYLFPGEKELFSADLNKYLAIKYTVDNQKITGGTAPEETERIIGKENKWLYDILVMILVFFQYNDKITKNISSCDEVEPNDKNRVPATSANLGPGFDCSGYCP